MEFEYDVYWCAVKGVTVADAVGRVYGPHAKLRAPTGEETIRGSTANYSRFGMQMENARRLSVCFVKGEWTFLLSPHDHFDIAKLFPSFDVLNTSVSQYEWSCVAHWSNGEVDWSVYGSTEDEFVRTVGQVPAIVEPFTFAVTNCELAPLKAAQKITGFRHHTHLRPRGFQIIEVKEPPRELLVSDGSRLEEATEAQVEGAIAHYLATPGSSITLTVGATTLTGRYLEGQLHVEIGGHVAQPSRGTSKFYPVDVQRCFADFFDEGRRCTKYTWAVPA